MKTASNDSSLTGSLSRRRFLQAAGAGVAATALTGLAADEAPAPRMTLGFSTYGTKSMMTEDALHLLGLIGFDTVELATRTGWDADPDGMSAGRLVVLKGLLNRWGMGVRALMEDLRPERDLTMHRMVLDRIHRVGEFAHKLSPDHPPIIETTLGSGDWDSVRSLYQDRVGDWQSAASDTQTILAIKPHRFGAMNRPSQAVELITALGDSPWLRMAYDFSHYCLRDMTLEDTVAESLPYMAFVAVKDTVIVDDKARFVLAGEAGTIDYVKLLKLLQRGGYRGDINCEVSGMVSAQPNYDPARAAETCYANVATAFLEAGVKRGEMKS